MEKLMNESIGISHFIMEMLPSLIVLYVGIELAFPYKSS